MAPQSVGWLTALIVLSGCVGAAPVQGPAASDLHLADPVVIAVIDTGVNPYRPVFARDTPLDFGHMAPARVRELTLSREGDYDSRVTSDEGKWEAIGPGELVWFEGTRLLAISFHDQIVGRPYILDYNFVAHGTMTASLAAREAPDAIILAVQVYADRGCGDDQTCIFPPSMVAAMEWISEQPWIDVVSISIGIPGNAPEPSILHENAERYHRASRLAAESGKLILNGVGNTLAPPVASELNGPPWVITVGGSQLQAKGEPAEGSKTFDVASNYTDWAPIPGTIDDVQLAAGTSVATPIVAGTIAEALRMVREANGTPDPRALRQSLNASAVVFDSTHWDPAAQIPSNGSIEEVLASGSLPILIQPQMGWGYVNSSLAPEIARRVLENDLSIPAGKEQAAIFQAEWQRAREEYWARYG